MMTNGEKFKTAEERRRWYSWYCKLCDDECVKPVDEFDWIDLYYKEDLKPCPFCGSEASIISGTEDHYVVCRNDDCAAALIARSFSSVEEAIAKWNRRSE